MDERQPVRVMVVDDHPLMREVLRDYLEALTGYEVSGEAGSAEEALELVAGLSPDLVLVDTSLKGMSGIDLVRILNERRPDLRCLMLSGHGQQAYVGRALDAGAAGYVLKGDPAELPEAMETVLAGEVYLSPMLRTGA